jgi:hypothetical protein
MKDVNPFVGISSFTEEDYKRFYGREKDSEKLLRLIERYPVTILTGPSGYGKSSLVTCGVVTPLKQMRAENPRTPLVLVVRNWGRARVEAANVAGRIPRLFADVLKLAAQDAIDGDPSLDRAAFMKIFTDREHEFQSDPRAFNYLVSDISRAYGGVVIIFDQFEEILRIGNDTVREVSNLINQAKRADGVSILLSLRNERLDLLQYIELDGPLAQSTLYLKGMSLKQAEDVFSSMAEFGGMKLAEGFITSLNRDNAKEADLFYFQAILSEIWEELKPIDRIDEAALERAFGPRVAEDPARLAFEHALLRIVDRCFDHNDAGSLRLRSHAIRIAPLLSSGGFKTNQTRDDLYEKAYGEAMRSTRAQIELGPKSDGSATTEAKKAEVAQKLEEAISGSFRALHAGRLVDAAQLQAQIKTELDDALRELEEGTLLKSYNATFDDASVGSHGDTRWELTHDRLGNAMYEWSRKNLNRVKDNRSASLASRGITPISVDEHQVGRSGGSNKDWRFLSWRGCSVEPDRDLSSPEAGFRDISFGDCDFRGSAFVSCNFENCTFYNCNLNGAAFRSCTFRKCTFVDIKRADGNSIGFLNCKFEDAVTFKNCFLTQLTIAGNTKYNASVEFRGGALLSSRFEEPEQHPGKVIKFEGVEADRNFVADGMTITA